MTLAHSVDLQNRTLLAVTRNVLVGVCCPSFFSCSPELSHEHQFRFCLFGLAFARHLRSAEPFPIQPPRPSCKPHSTEHPRRPRAYPTQSRFGLPFTDDANSCLTRQPSLYKSQVTRYTATLPTAFFSRARTASTIGTLLFFVALFPYFAVDKEGVSANSRRAACLLPPTCLALGTLPLTEFEDAGVVGSASLYLIFILGSGLA